ncbi:hypothetical protein MSG28_007232 [Choristoneura fumiferana]|uniref:Uncharacterized protein n=1 Tax=Choristoneura fumiferana TaxID=7141 RepID=A0ACC0JW89_CHOFU|nr:hypothetical protein MSG28_007232 [Choristoneura fumiferana]
MDQTEPLDLSTKNSKTSISVIDLKFLAGINSQLVKLYESSQYLNCKTQCLQRGGKNVLPCQVCLKTFDRPSLLKRHMRTHTDTCGAVPV